jgi:eukaryotic-like serine/threonine-protein kinase
MPSCDQLGVRHEDIMDNRIETIFSTARKLHNDARLDFLDIACRGDTKIRADVDALLTELDLVSGIETVEDPDRTLAQTPARTDGSLPSEEPSQMIGKYKLLQKIGEGGFGTVWMANQKEPVKRRVALKIIKLGMDTKQVIARFEAERQALAMMDHPNIAKVFDAGSTEIGRPYFVMELVKGVPILEYCDTEKLDTRSRLNLFVLVCQAIQHAHQKGIIHRDIKPGNVLVTFHDGVPVPKVIDFGIAKATSQELTQKTLFTEHHQMIGTPAYMSPEQAEMSGLDIDTRSDIYSLGVLLYELLTGTTPFAHQELMERGFGEMMRIIREETPHKPSTRLSTLGETGTRTALQRHTDIRKLGLVLRGDLDWIVMKCLEKDRARRYDTANGIAEDIRRHLTDEPVTAGPPSASYRLHKFVKRNRNTVVASIAIACILVLGVVGTSTGMVWAINERARADDEATRANLSAAAETEARKTAQANEKRAVDEAQRAERELARANEIKKLITEMLQSIRPEEAMGTDITLLKGILDDASERLENGNISDELIEAELHEVIGGVYSSLGLYSDSDKHYPHMLSIRSRLLGDQHQETLASMSILATLRQEQNLYPQAEQLYLQALEGQRAMLGEEDYDTLQTITNLSTLYRTLGRYDEAEPLVKQAIEIYQRLHGPESLSSLSVMLNLATVYLSSGRWSEAEALFLQVFESLRRVVGDEDPNTLICVNNLATLYTNQGRYREAEELVLEWIEIVQRIYGQEHPSTLNMFTTLANIYGYQERYEESEEIILKSIEINQRTLGEEHSATLTSMMNLGMIYNDLRKFEEAESIYLSVLKVQRANFSQDDPGRLTVMNNLALLYSDQGRIEEAEALGLETIEIQRRAWGGDHPSTLGSISNLGHLYISMERYEDAAKRFETSLPAKRRVMGSEHPWTLVALTGLAEAYKFLGRYDEAVTLYVESLEIQERVLGVEHSSTNTSRRDLAYLLQTLQRYPDAESLFLKVIEVEKNIHGDEHAYTLGSMTNLGLLYIEIGNHEDAASMFETNIPIMKNVLGTQHPWTANAIWGLAESYKGLGRVEESILLFRELLLIETASAEESDADAMTLNSAAWTLLTNDVVEIRDPIRGLAFAERACAIEEASGGSALWMYLDTLALAQHLTGDNESAIASFRRAMTMIPEGGYPEMHAILAKYEKALNEGVEVPSVDE